MTASTAQARPSAPAAKGKNTTSEEAVSQITQAGLDLQIVLKRLGSLCDRLDALPPDELSGEAVRAALRIASCLGTVGDYARSYSLRLAKRLGAEAG
jgi:hypothetical protein